jgi:hypothetical protein
MSLIEQLQKGEIALEFNIGDQSVDLQRVLKIAFPKDGMVPSGRVRYYYTYPTADMWVGNDYTPNMQIVPISEFLKELNPPEKSIAERLRNGEIAIHMDSKTEETITRLKEIVKEAFPDYPNPSGESNYYCKEVGRDTWTFWGITDAVKKYTIVPITTLLSNKMENKEIIGYKLAKSEYAEAAKKIGTGYEPFGFNQFVDFTLNSRQKDEFEEAGVLNLWFEPVYKEEAPTIKIGDYTGTIDKKDRLLMIEGMTYNSSFIQNLISILSAKHIHFINVGCNGQIKLTKKELENILNQM